MKKIFYIISLITIILASSFFVLIGYWLLKPYNTMVIKDNDKVWVDKKIYHPGDRITYAFEYCKNGDNQGIVSRSLVNSVKINYTDYIGNIHKGCGKLTKNDLVIPEFAEPGTYHLEAVAEFKVNPIRVYRDSWKSVDFEIK